MPFHGKRTTSRPGSRPASVLDPGGARRPQAHRRLTHRPYCPQFQHHYGNGAARALPSAVRGARDHTGAPQQVRRRAIASALQIDQDSKYKRTPLLAPLPCQAVYASPHLWGNSARSTDRFSGYAETFQDVLARGNRTEAICDGSNGVVVGYFRIVSAAVLNEGDQKIETCRIP